MYMKTNLMLLLILAVVISLLTACGRGREGPDEPQPTPDREVALTIRWGYGAGRGTTLPETSPDAELVQITSSRFGVSIVPVLTRGGYDVSNPPDIFVTYDPHLLLASGVIREIPLDFLATFAPQYYGLRTSAPFGMDVGRGLEPNSAIGLKQYLGGTGNLVFYSAYRLDWLEEHGILPAGIVVPLDDGRVYFTDTPFTYHQFLEIMRAFSSSDRRNGLAVFEDVERLHNIAQLMGMWGLNLSIVNDNGQPNYYFASPRYKSFLQFMSTMYAEGLINLIGRHVTGTTAAGMRLGVVPGGPEIGWFQVHWNILGPNQPAMEVLNRRPEARLLITPPEIGPYLDSGVGGLGTVLPYNPARMWVIGAQVSDEKLAAILQIFEYITFDTEAFVLTSVGIAGDHFEWAGEPYNSLIVRDANMTNRALRSGAFVLHTFINLAERDIFFLGDNAVIRYSSSPMGRDAVIPPHREDVFGDFALQYAALTAQYGRELFRIRQSFFSSAIRGEIDIDAMWDWYIDELHNNGLLQFLDLVEQFPVVGP